MKDKVRKILARVFFAACIIATISTAYFTLNMAFVAWAYEEMSTWVVGVSITRLVIAAVAAFVFLGLCLSFKGKHKLF